MTTLKKTRTFDLNLFSGSSESIRQAVKGYYTQEDANMFFKDAMIENIEKNPLESWWWTGEANDFVLPRRKYSNRIFAGLDTPIRSDDEWKKFLLGGSFADLEYPGFYNSKIYADHANTFSLPYLPREIIGTDKNEGLSLTTEYFNYYSRYQTDVDLLQSELQAPNIYLLQSGMLDYDASVTSPMGTGEYPAIKEFLTNTFVNSEKTIDEKQKNLFVVNNNVQ